MKIPAVNEWIVITNNVPGWKVVFDVFDQDMFTMLSPSQGVSIDSVPALI